MKVTVPVGKLEIVLEFSNGEGQSALDFIRAIQEDEKAKAYSQKMSDITKQAKTPSDVEGLNQIQYRTWSYLTDNDTPDGVHVSQVAHAFGISTAAANSRLLTLYELGYAKRVKKGYYRPCLQGDAK